MFVDNNKLLTIPVSFTTFFFHFLKRERKRKKEREKYMERERKQKRKLKLQGTWRNTKIVRQESIPTTLRVCVCVWVECVSQQEGKWMSERESSREKVSEWELENSPTFDHLYFYNRSWLKMRQILPSSFSGKNACFSSFFLFHFSSLRALLFSSLSILFHFHSCILSLSYSSLSSLRRANLVEDGRDREWNWFCSNERRMCCHELMNLLQFSSLLFSFQSLFLSLLLPPSLSVFLTWNSVSEEEGRSGRQITQNMCEQLSSPSSSASSLYHSLPLPSLPLAIFYCLLPFEWRLSGEWMKKCIKNWIHQ